MSDNQRIDDLRRRIQRDPASIAFAQLAEELRRANQLDEAVATCRAGLAIHPSYLSARVTLGRALLALDRPEEAEAELKTVLHDAPHNLPALRALGEIARKAGRYHEALTHFQAALGIATNDPDLQEMVDDLSRKVRPARPARVREQRTIEALEQFLDAINVARTESRP
jgi:tetratricopeptide (TPR) repeat protein